MTCTSSKDSDQLVYSCSLISLHWVLYGQPRNQGFFRQTAKTEALPRVLGNRGIRPFISWEQGNKSLKLKGTGEQRQFWGTGNVENQDFDFGKQGKCPFFFQGNKGTGTPHPHWEGRKTGKTVPMHRMIRFLAVHIRSSTMNFVLVFFSPFSIAIPCLGK